MGSTEPEPGQPERILSEDVPASGLARIQKLSASLRVVPEFDYESVSPRSHSASDYRI